MGGLSGCAQRVLFNMLEEVALEGKLQPNLSVSCDTMANAPQCRYPSNKLEGSGVSSRECEPSARAAVGVADHWAP